MQSVLINTLNDISQVRKTGIVFIKGKTENFTPAVFLNIT